MLKSLVVDNNPVLQKAISVLLEKEGCEVVTADNGLDALETMKSYVPDLIFTDLVMPLVDGEQLCKVVKNTKRLSSVFIVVVSAIVFEEEQSLMEEVECDLYIAKGSLIEMKENLRKALQQYRLRTKTEQRFIGTMKKEQDSVTAEILQEKKHRENIVACLSEGVIELNGQGKIVEINQAALTILEYREEQVIGELLIEFEWKDKKPEINNWIDIELAGRGMKSLEFKDDNPVFYKDKVLTLTLLAISSEDIFGICIINDITRQFEAEIHNKKLESSIQQLKKMEAMSGMAGGMAHDFNNLLTVICGNLDMLQLSIGEECTGGGHLLSQAKESALHAVDLMRKISNFSPFGVIERKRTDIAQLVNEAVAAFRQESKLEFSIDISEGLFINNIDSKQIMTALHNIFQNSVDAKAKNIAVQLKMNLLAEPIIDSGQYVPQGNYIELSIKDDGTGIEKENLTQIFDPYFTTKPRGSLKGMGLGLAVVYSTVKNSDGYVMVDSRIAEGTRLSIFLPNPDGSVIGDACDWEAARMRDQRLIIVDEDENSRNVGTALLEYLGFEVISGQDGTDILDTCREYLDTGKNFTAAIINLKEVDSLKGVKICRELHRLDSGLKVIAMSNSLTDPVVKDFREYGFANILPRPYSVEDLKSLFSSV